MRDEEQVLQRVGVAVNRQTSDVEGEGVVEEIKLVVLGEEGGIAFFSASWLVRVFPRTELTGLARLNPIFPRWPPRQRTKYRTVVVVAAATVLPIAGCRSGNRDGRFYVVVFCGSASTSATLKRVDAVISMVFC